MDSNLQQSTRSVTQVTYSVVIWSIFFMISSSNMLLFIRFLRKWMKTSRSLYVREVVCCPSAYLSVLPQVRWTAKLCVTYKANPKRYRTFEIAHQWAGAGRLRRWCCVAGTLSFILTLATSRHFQLVMSYAALSEHVFSALGNFGRGEDFPTHCDDCTFVSTS